MLAVQSACMKKQPCFWSKSVEDLINVISITQAKHEQNSMLFRGWYLHVIVSVYISLVTLLGTQSCSYLNSQFHSSISRCQELHVHGMNVGTRRAGINISKTVGSRNCCYSTPGGSYCVARWPLCLLW